MKDRDEKVREEESRSGTRDVERAEEKTVVFKRCADPYSSDVFEEFGSTDDLGSFGDSWEDLHGDSFGFSECVPAVSSGVPVVTDVSDSPPSVGVLGDVFPSDSE